jgi:superfamily II DNA/RNA helicase
MQNFQELHISASVKKRLAVDFSAPIAVRAAITPPAIAGKYVLAAAQSGKTLAPLFPVIERLTEGHVLGIDPLVLVGRG